MNKVKNAHWPLRLVAMGGASLAAMVACQTPEETIDAIDAPPFSAQALHNCGDGICDPGEDCDYCIEDCGEPDYEGDVVVAGRTYLVTDNHGNTSSVVAQSTERSWFWRCLLTYPSTRNFGLECIAPNNDPINPFEWGSTAKYAANDCPPPATVSKDSCSTRMNGLLYERWQAEASAMPVRITSGYT